MKENNALKPLMYILIFLAILILAYHFGVAKTFRIKLPASVDPENVYISYGIYHRGLYCGEVEGKQNQWEYQLGVPPYARLKILIMAPGYQMIALDSAKGNIYPGLTYKPKFKPAKTVNLKGKVIDSQGLPCPNQEVHISYDLNEAYDFYNIADGSLDVLSFGKSRTDKNGEFNISVPYLLDDPFFNKYNNFNVKKYRVHILGKIIEPTSIYVQETYSDPVLIKILKPVTVYGQISPEFIKENGLNREGCEYRINFCQTSGDGEMCSTIHMKQDKNLSFERILRPGVYNVYIIGMKGCELQEKILIDERFILNEGDQKEFVF